MAYRCTHCGLSNFEADDARCPQCLRRGALIDANASLPDEQRQWGKIVLLVFLNMLFVWMPFYGIWDLIERSEAQSWPVTFASVTRMKDRRLRGCEIDYAFTVAGKRFEGHTTHGSCPRRGDELMVSYRPEDPTRHLTASGYLIFLDLFAIGFGAFGIVAAGSVLLYMLFPKHDGLRRFAALVGSKDARAAIARRSPPHSRRERETYLGILFPR